MKFMTPFGICLTFYTSYIVKSRQNLYFLQGAVELFDARIQQYLNESSHSGTNITQQEKMRDVFVASTAFEQFLVEFAQYHLNHTTPQIQFNSTHVGEY